MKKSILLILQLTIIFSCTKQLSDNQHIDKVGSQVIAINAKSIDNKFIAKSSKIIEEVSYILLESKPDNTIGEISNMIIKKELIYIHDQLSERIYTFNLEGKHISTLSAKGQGYGEYVSIDGFCVDPENDNILIFDNRLRHLLSYDSKGSFISSIKIDASVKGIAKTSSRLFLNTEFYWNKNIFKTFPEQNQIVSFDESIKEGHTYLKYNFNEYLTEFPRIKNKFSHFEDIVSYIDDVGSTIYYFSNEGRIQERYVIDFGNLNFPNNYSDIDNRSEINNLYQLRNDKKLAMVTDFKETKNHIYIKYSYNGILWNFFLSKVSGQKINVPYLLNDIDGIQIPEPCCNTDSTFIGYIDAFYFKEAFTKAPNRKSKRVNEINQKLQIIDNPVLVVYKFKNTF